jgi:hypothetical protein
MYSRGYWWPLNGESAALLTLTFGAELQNASAACTDRASISLSYAHIGRVSPHPCWGGVHQKVTHFVCLKVL